MIHHQLPKSFSFKLIHFSARWILAVVFLWSGISKAINPSEFLNNIESFYILPHHWAWIVSIWLPYLEITCAIALPHAGRWSCTASLLIIVLLGLFIWALSLAWWHGIDISCGCFGSIDKSPHAYAISRNVILISLACISAFSTRRPPIDKKSTAN